MAYIGILLTAERKEAMGYRELYTAANMAGEDYNISDKGLSITPAEIHVQVRPGGTVEGQFVVAGPAEIALTGFLTSDDFHMQLRRDHFAGNPDRISWRFDARSLKEGDVVEGTIGIVSNRGEYEVPFKAEAVLPQIEGKEVQEIKNQNSAAERLQSLADEDWGSAVRLFYRKEFQESLMTEEERMLYRGLSRYPGNEQNVEEFLIAACGKEPVEYSTDVKEIRTEILDIGRSERTARERYSTERTAQERYSQERNSAGRTIRERGGSERVSQARNQSDTSEYRIPIKRTGWGYTKLRVTMIGSFLSPNVSYVESEDFLGDTCSFQYRVDKYKLHAGRNFGRIILKSPYQEISIPVEVQYRRRGDQRARQERESRRAILEIMRHYERLHLSWAGAGSNAESGSGKDSYARSGAGKDSTRKGSGGNGSAGLDEGEWLRQADELVRRLTFLRRDSVLPRLYAAQLMLMQNRIHNAVMELEGVRRRLAGAGPDEVLEMGHTQYKGETEVEYCYRQFLTALAYNDADIYTPRVGRILRERYRKNPSNWRIAWMMLQLLPEYAPGNAGRWNFLKKQFLNGCRSPIIYLEAWDMIAADPEYLNLQEDRRTGRYGGDAFERQVLLYALRKGLLGTEIMKSVLERCDRRRDFPRSLFHVLTKAYEQEKMRSLRTEIVRCICGLLIRSGHTEPEYFIWYSRAVERGVKTARLYDFYLQSLPEDYNGVIPDSVIRNAGRGGMLTSAGRAYYYRYLYQARREYPAVYEECREDIRNFLAAQIADHKMNENLAVLYRAALKDPEICPDNAGDLTKLSYLSHLRTTHLSMKKAAVVYAKSSRERAYPIEKGNCILPLYGEENRIFLEDEHQNRFTASVPYTCDRMMDPVQVPDPVSLQEMSDLPFALEISGASADSFEVTEDTLQYCEILVRSAGIDPAYRTRLKLRLLTFYEKKGDMERLRAMAGTIRPEDLETEARTETIAMLCRCGMYREAADWICGSGAGSCPAALLAETALGLKSLSGEEKSRQSDAGRIAWAAFTRGSAKRPILELLLETYDGLTSDLVRIRNAAVEAADEGEESDPLVVTSEDRLLSQILFSGDMIEDQELLLLREYERGGTHRSLAGAGIAQYCHYVFADWHKMGQEIMKLITDADQDGMSVEPICKLAFLKSLSERTEGFSEREGETAERFLNSLVKQEIVFPFYRRFTGTGPGLRLYDRETMIEYHNPAGVRGARGHVVIHCSIDRGGKQEPFVAREMKEMVRGFYVSSFFLFYGEQIHYFITDDPEEKNFVESGTIGQDVLMDISENDRFAAIDRISSAAARRDRAQTAQLLADYSKREYLTKELFGSEEDSDALY